MPPVCQRALVCYVTHVTLMTSVIRSSNGGRIVVATTAIFKQSYCACAVLWQRRERLSLVINSPTRSSDRITNRRRDTLKIIRYCKIQTLEIDDNQPSAVYDSWLHCCCRIAYFWRKKTPSADWHDDYTVCVISRRRTTSRWTAEKCTSITQRISQRDVNVRALQRWDTPRRCCVSDLLNIKKLALCVNLSKERCVCI